MVHHGLGVAGATKLVGAGEHFQQDDAQAVDIAALVQDFALGLLRAAVGRAADGHAEMGQVIVDGQVLGHTKVGDHH